MSYAALSALLLLVGCGRAPEAPPAAEPLPPQLEPRLPPPPRPNLDFELSGWTRMPGEQQIFGEQIYDYMNGEGEIPVACGYQSLIVTTWHHADGFEVKLELYDMDKPANAFGLYSQRRMPDDTFEQLTNRAKVSSDQVVFWRGPWTGILMADPPEAGTSERLLELARAIEAVLPEADDLPPLLSRLPREGLIDNSATFAHGKFAVDTAWFQTEDRLRLSPRTDVVAARYEGEVTMLVVEYPSQDVAGGVVDRLRQAFGGRDLESGGFLGRDGETFLAGIEVAGRVGLVAYAADEATAKRYLAALAATMATPGAPWTEA